MSGRHLLRKRLMMTGASTVWWLLLFISYTGNRSHHSQSYRLITSHRSIIVIKMCTTKSCIFSPAAPEVTVANLSSIIAIIIIFLIRTSCSLTCQSCLFKTSFSSDYFETTRVQNQENNEEVACCCLCAATEAIGGPFGRLSNALIGLKMKVLSLNVLQAISQEFSCKFK